MIKRSVRMMEAVKKTVKEDNLTPFPKGVSGNPGGRPKGQRNYATIYREALIKIGESRNMTPEEIEEEIEKVGLAKALDGDFAFQKDIKDRLHGKPSQSLELSGPNGGDIPVIVTVKYE